MDGITAPTPPEAVPTRELQDEVRVLIEAALNANSLVQRDALWHRVEDFCRTLASSLAREAALREDAKRLDKLFRILPFHVRHYFGGDEREFREGIDAAKDQPLPPVTFGGSHRALLASPSDPTEGQTNG